MAAEKRPGARGLFDLCAYCPDLCLDRCPVVAATGSTTFSPFAKMLQGWILEHGHEKPSEEIARSAYQCTGCLSCHDACLHKVDVEQALFGLRAELVDQGIAPFERQLFEVDEKRLVAAQASAVPKRYFVPEAQAVLFPGCKVLERSPRLLKDVLKVFEGLGIRFVGAADEAAVCCGYPLHAAGYRTAFEENARRLIRRLGRYKMVVVLSACCAYTMRTLFAAAGLEGGPRVALALELVAPLVLRTDHPPLPGRFGYHDSCFLGRHLGQYDAPREMLARMTGTRPLETRHHHGKSRCCGAGGGWDVTAPVHAELAAGGVLEEAHDAGMDVVVSANPACTAHLSASARTGGPEVADIMTVVARWLRAKR